MNEPRNTDDLMMNVQLANRRGIKKEELIDHMGRYELGANLFRIQTTEATLERLAKEGVTSQAVAEREYRRIGNEVRKMVRDATGKNPEDLPVKRRLSDVHKQLKIGHKGMERIDSPTVPKKKTAKRSPKKK